MIGNVNKCAVEIYPNTLYTTLNKTLDKFKIQHFRLHDLRHYTASMLLALGVPNKYAMNIMGHETERMLTTVYQHLKNQKWMSLIMKSIVLSTIP